MQASSNSVLVDINGNPIPSGEERMVAEEKLKEYMAKHHARFQDWFTQYGATARPPIKYDLGRREWEWVD